MATIKDVAADAGVSVGTVSRVLNNLYVKPGNRERVEASIRKLNYRVDTYARGMKAKRTYTAAILVPDLINPFFAMLVNDNDGGKRLRLMEFSRGIENDKSPELFGRARLL